MKKILAIVMMLASAGIQAQDVKMRSVGSVELVVSYSLDQLCDYPAEYRNNEWREQGTLLLEVGGNMAHSYVVEEQQAIMRSILQFREKNHWAIELYSPHALVGETFIGLPKAGELTHVVNLDAAGIFQYTEAVPRQKWKVIPGEHRRVLDYDCQKATCQFRGREYVAWFAEDIPVGFGPWKLGGLPGLIMEAYDTKNEYHFTATGIERPKEARQMMLYDEELRPIKREKALKMEAMMHKDHGAYAADYGITIHIVGYFGSGDGMEHDAQPYHPLELK